MRRPSLRARSGATAQSFVATPLIFCTVQMHFTDSIDCKLITFIVHALSIVKYSRCKFIVGGKMWWFLMVESCGLAHCGGGGWQRMPWYRQAACDIWPHEASSPHDSSLLAPRQVPSKPPPAPPRYPYSMSAAGPTATSAHGAGGCSRRARAARGACVWCRSDARASQTHNWMSRGYIELCRLQMVSDRSGGFCKRRGLCARPT